MKKIILIFLISFSLPVCGQLRKHAIKFSPMILSFKGLNLQYEYRFYRNHAIQLWWVRINDSFYIDTRMQGWQTTLDYKFYISQKRYAKNYISLYTRFQDFNFRGSGDNIQHKHLGGGLILGKTFNPFSVRWWVIDMYVGANFISKKYQIISTNQSVDLPLPPTIYGIGPRFGITTGVTF